MWFFFKKNNSQNTHCNEINKINKWGGGGGEEGIKELKWANLTQRGEMQLHFQKNSFKSQFAYKCISE